MAIALAARPRREVALMYAHTCNIACRHCGILSSPQNKNRMKHEDAIRYIREAAEIPAFCKVTFTGGEPFLFGPEHEEMIGLARSLGLASRVVTNGFWAKNLNKGLEFLGRMKAAGLSELNFSADQFHLEFQDSSVLRNGLECARQLGFARIVSFVTNVDSVPPLDQFSEMYGLPRDQVMDLRDVMHDVRKMETLKEETIFVYAGWLIGLGRAAEHPDDLRHFPLEMWPRTGCGEVVNKPVIYPDGSFQACCCAGGKIKTFTVGNLHEHSLATLYARMEVRAQYRHINQFGPADLFDVIKRARPDLRRASCHSSICEVCVRATEGLAPEEIDRILDAEMAERALESLGVPLLRDPAPLQPNTAALPKAWGPMHG